MKTNYSDVPTLREFFLAHGGYVGKPRVIKPYLAECFRYVKQWMFGGLPGGKRNLSINIPPRHGKTFLARDVVSYSMGLWPDSEFIYVSYAAKLAVEQTKQIKFAMNSEWYQKMWPWVGEVFGQQDHFATKYGGKIFGVGMDGPITGFGAGQKRSEFGGAIIIDDILRASDARSDVERNKANEWYTGALLSRKNHDRTPILNISQRLHPDDIVGHLKANDPDDWYFIVTPAVDEERQTTIWPETFSYESAMRLKEIDPFTFYSQYQQEPIVPGGAMIKAEWWRYYTDFDAINRKCDVKIITADTAYGVKDANDYSVFQCWGFEGSQRAYLLDQVRGKWGYEQLVQVACEFWDKHSATDPYSRFQPVYRMYIENKASGQSLVQQHDLFREKGINAFPWNPGQKDKVARVKECLAAIYSGRVILPDTPEASWMDDFIAECSAFSEDMSHSRDDCVDSMTMALLLWRGELGGRSD